MEVFKLKLPFIPIDIKWRDFLTLRFAVERVKVDEPLSRAHWFLGDAHLLPVLVSEDDLCLVTLLKSLLKLAETSSARFKQLSTSS
jgi:hypothetical protein